MKENESIFQFSIPKRLKHNLLLVRSGHEQNFTVNRINDLPESSCDDDLGSACSARSMYADIIARYPKSSPMVRQPIAYLPPPFKPPIPFKIE